MHRTCNLFTKYHIVILTFAAAPLVVQNLKFRMLQEQILKEKDRCITFIFTYTQITHG